jgi:hypothetical protein
MKFTLPCVYNTQTPLKGNIKIKEDCLTITFGKSKSYSILIENIEGIPYVITYSQDTDEPTNVIKIE